MAELRQRAEKGDAEEQYNLGGMYARGEGVPQDYAEAARWFRKAAELGHAGAQSNLGAMYVNGRGVPQDYAEAVRWYRKGAEQGDAVTQNNLGKMYSFGHGVPQDYVQALMWFSLAVSRSSEDVRLQQVFATARDNLAAEMTPQQIAEAQRLAREWKPKR